MASNFGLKGIGSMFWGTGFRVESAYPCEEVLDEVSLHPEELRPVPDHDRRRLKSHPASSLKYKTWEFPEFAGSTTRYDSFIELCSNCLYMWGSASGVRLRSPSPTARVKRSGCIV